MLVDCIRALLLLRPVFALVVALEDGLLFRRHTHHENLDLYRPWLVSH